jgi:uncharacterized protein YraI
MANRWNLSIIFTIIALLSVTEIANAKCIGVVTGLSNYYNSSTGSGFLAYRAGPTSKAAQLGELLNGSRVQILGKQGNWLRVRSDEIGREGWVHRNWVSYDCRQLCIGVVSGLTDYYNQATGSGFLTFRAGPTSSATQLGELFNGMRVEILGRRGNWLRVYSEDIGSEGWVHRRWIANSCG